MPSLFIVNTDPATVPVMTPAPFHRMFGLFPDSR
jgi:hypothetical protein